MLTITFLQGIPVKWHNSYHWLPWQSALSGTHRRSRKVQLGECIIWHSRHNFLSLLGGTEVPSVGFPSNNVHFEQATTPKPSWNVVCRLRYHWGPGTDDRKECRASPFLGVGSVNTATTQPSWRPQINNLEGITVELSYRRHGSRIAVIMYLINPQQRSFGDWAQIVWELIGKTRRQE